MTSRVSEHEYEPIAPAIKRILAPVIRISDTDVMPVADSDDSIDDPQRFHGAITLDGDLILPLDGTLEDSIMEGKELRHDGDTPEEEPTLHQYQIKIEQTFVQHDQQPNNQVILYICYILFCFIYPEFICQTIILKLTIIMNYY